METKVNENTKRVSLDIDEDKIKQLAIFALTTKNVKLKKYLEGIITAEADKIIILKKQKK